MDEFELIRRYFTGHSGQRDDVVLGVGDDAALLRVPPDQELAVSVDSLIAGVHFPDSLPPRAVGHRALAVNLSDLAAMGAQPAWAVLALTVPQADAAWIQEFARGFLALAERYNVALVGGNLAHGPLNVTVTVHGLVPSGQAITRQGARPGDRLFVTGTLGAAATGLRRLQNHASAVENNPCVQRFCFPEPRLEAGLRLRGFASAAIDVSDGLIADLRHVLEASGVGARLQIEQLPLSPCVVERSSRDEALDLAMSGGDDYELCFSIPPQHLAQLKTRLSVLGCGATCIGEVTVEKTLRCLRNDGSQWPLPRAGYTHF